DLDRASGLVARLEGPFPGRGIPDLDRGGERLGLRDALPADDRRGPFGLEAEHPRRGAAPAPLELLVALPGRGDVAGVPDRERVNVRRAAAESRRDLVGDRLLPFDPIRVD